MKFFIQTANLAPCRHTLASHSREIPWLRTFQQHLKRTTYISEITHSASGPCGCQISPVSALVRYPHSSNTLLVVFAPTFGKTLAAIQRQRSRPKTPAYPFPKHHGESSTLQSSKSSSSLGFGTRVERRAYLQNGLAGEQVRESQRDFLRSSRSKNDTVLLSDHPSKTPVSDDALAGLLAGSAGGVANAMFRRFEVEPSGFTTQASHSTSPGNNPAYTRSVFRSTNSKRSGGIS